MNNEPEYNDVSSFLRVYFKQLQRYIVTGVMVWVPLFITMWVSWWFISKVASKIGDAMRFAEQYVNQVGKRVPALDFLEHFRFENAFTSMGTGLLLCILLFLCTGFLTRYIVGRKIIATGELLVSKIPLISRVYLAVQQIRDVFVNREGAVFQQVVLLEYPRKGITAVGFVTSNEQGMVQETAGKKLTAVFVPTTPNPTSGFLLYLSPDDLIPLDISVEDAMKLIVSGGAYLPGKVPLPELEVEQNQD